MKISEKSIVIFIALLNILAEAEDRKKNVITKPKLVLPMDLESKFIPSGWVGDGKEGDKCVSLKREAISIEGKSKVGIHIVYRNCSTWAGIYWQYPENNWGGNLGISLQGATSINFYAKGASGTEILEFKSGGITGKFGDSFESSTGKVILSREWTKYSIDIKKHDLTNVVSGFSWNASSKDNGGNLDFYLACITVE